jgi:hypothetical protein|tara:strand:- start:21095 stop:21763 length:669 start_codon:yes stop_codon:yes gene_type:complete
MLVIGPEKEYYMGNNSKENRFFRLIPMAGILIFVVLYFVAASVYPGGSNLNRHLDGFDWMNNYWCNLTDKRAMNGVVNESRQYAQTGILVLCFSLAYYFYKFPFLFKLKTPWKLIVPISGIAATTFSLFIHSRFHDIMAVLTAIAISIAVIGIFFGLKRHNLTHFIWTGIVCMFLIVLNGYIYFSENYIEMLPLIQKVTFAAVLLWFFLLTAMYGSEMEKEP